MTREPSPMPDAVIDSIFRWCKVGDDEWMDIRRAHQMLRDLKWGNLNGCYFFRWAGMYVGVEIDGYIHT